MKEKCLFINEKTGKQFTRNLTWDEINEYQVFGVHYKFPDGTEGRRLVREELQAAGITKAQRVRSRAWSKPLMSDAASVCDGDEGRRMNQEVRAAGISGVKYCEKTGDCYFESRAGRNAEMKRRGFMDKDAGFGDYAGRVG